jgi:PIN domain nuclease of toxin-antitoxin system
VTVVDASALLAFLLQEPGQERVAQALATSIISSVNLAETLTRLRRLGVDVDTAIEDIRATGLTIVAATETQAIAAAKIDVQTISKGLSVGDRMCLALAIERNLPAMTTEKSWPGLAHGVNVVLIR